jgi:hypothetical protein
MVGEIPLRERKVEMRGQKKNVEFLCAEMSGRSQHGQLVDVLSVETVDSDTEWVPRRNVLGKTQYKGLDIPVVEGERRGEVESCFKAGVFPNKPRVCVTLFSKPLDFHESYRVKGEIANHYIPRKRGIVMCRDERPFTKPPTRGAGKESSGGELSTAALTTIFKMLCCNTSLK